MSDRAIALSAGNLIESLLPEHKTYEDYSSSYLVSFNETGGVSKIEQEYKGVIKVLFHGDGE